jgi:hypothetical protein
MTLYSVALFVHIVGALLLFVTLTVEGVALRVGFAAAPLNRVVGPISAVAILVPGIYMVASGVGWKGWVVVGLTGWVLVAVLGAATGISVMRGRISSRTAVISWLLRIGLALGIVFDMTVKPDIVVAVAVVVAGALAGALATTLATPLQVRRT